MAVLVKVIIYIYIYISFCHPKQEKRSLIVEQKIRMVDVKYMFQ